MIQGASEPAGPGWAWGWGGDGDGDGDGDGAGLALLALAVVAVTALVLHWLGSGQEQEAAGLAPIAPGQAGGAGPALPPKAKVSGGIKGHSSGLGKPDPPGCSQGGPMAAGAQHLEPPRGRGLAATVTSRLKTPGRVAGGQGLGQQHDSAAPETLRAKGRGTLLGRSQAGGISAPLLIHFTPRSPGREIEERVEAGELRAKVPGDQAPVHAKEQDTTPWHQGVRSPGSLGRGPGSQRRQVGNSSGDRTYHSPKQDPLRLGTVVSVWDTVDAASSLSTGVQRPPSPQVLPPSHMLAGPLMDGSERGSGKESPQPAPVLILGSGAEAGESREAGPWAPPESKGSPAPMEGGPWAGREVVVTRSFRQAPGSMGSWPEGLQWGWPLLSQGQGTTEACHLGKAGSRSSGNHSSFSSGLGGAEKEQGHSSREGGASWQGQKEQGRGQGAGSLDRGELDTDICRGDPSPSPSAPPRICVPNPPPRSAPPPSARPHPGPSPAPTLPTSSPSDSLPFRVSQGPAGDDCLKDVPALTAAPAPAPDPSPASAPVTAPAPTSGPGLTSHEPSGALFEGKQGGQISTSWENLISMVLRSHPFPRQEGPQGRAPSTAPGSPRDPSTFALSENRESGALPEGAVFSLKDSHSSARMVPGTGTGGLAEAGCQPQQKKTPSASTPGLPTGPRGDGDEDRHPAFLLPRAAMPRAPSLPAEPAQPGPAPSPTARPEVQPVPRPRKHSLCRIAENSEWEVSQAAPRQHQGETTAERPSSAGSRGDLTEKQKETQQLMVFLQRPRSWGVVAGPRKPSPTGQETAPGVALQRRLDLGSCLDILAFARQHGEPCLAQKACALMSDNLLRVLGDSSLYRQLSGADRERILSLRTGRGQAVLGVLVLPSLYQMNRSGPTGGAPGEGAPVAGPAPLPPRSHVHVFNPRENTWQHLTEVPEEAPLQGCGLCTMHNYLFLAGGVRGSGAKATCSNEVFCYNPLTNIWSQMRPMQQARAQLKLVALDGLLYAIGGECLYSMERYDPRTDAWTSRAPLPAGTFPVAHEAVACRGDIYVTGGHLFCRLLRYSPVKDTWDECTYSASHRRSSDMVALGGFLYRFDLLRGVGAAVMRYNTVTGSWSRAAPLPLPDPAPLRCAVLDDTIYCLSHQVTATLTVSEGTAQFQAKGLQPFPLGNKGVLCPFILTLPPADPVQTAI